MFIFNDLILFCKQTKRNSLSKILTLKSIFIQNICPGFLRFTSKWPYEHALSSVYNDRDKDLNNIVLKTELICFKDKNDKMKKIQ